MNTETITLPRARLAAVLCHLKTVCTGYRDIIKCVYLEAADGFLTLRGTDGDLALSQTMPTLCVGTLSPCAVPLIDFIRYVNSSKEPECVLSCDGDTLGIRGGRASHSLRTMPVEDFPLAPVVPDDVFLGMDAGEFVRMSAICKRGVATEHSRYALQGVMLESDEQGVRMIGTDGRRLVVVEAEAGCYARNHGVYGSFVLPTSMLLILAKLANGAAEAIRMTFTYAVCAKLSDTANVHVSSASWTLTAHASHQLFPKYRDVIPAPSNPFEFDRLEAVAVIKEVSVMRPKAMSVNLGGGKLSLATRDEETGAVSSGCVQCKHLGEDDVSMRTGFSPAFLLDALGTLGGETVHAELEAPYRPIMIESPGITWVIMPTQLDV